MARSMPVASVLALLLLMSSEAMSQGGGPPMIGFGFSSEPSDPPTSENPILRPMTPEEFSDALTRAQAVPGKRRGPTREQVGDILGEMVGAVTAEVVSGVMPTKIGGGLAVDMSAAQATGKAIKDPVASVSADAFRIWWNWPDERDRLTILMEEAGVSPENVLADPDMIYRGGPGFLDYWVDLLVVTQQQLALKRKARGGSLIEPWLVAQIETAQSARAEVRTALRIADPDAVDPDEEYARQYLNAFRKLYED